MAEFCLECFNKYVADENVTENQVVMSVDFCEGCGECKPCVVRYRRRILNKIHSILKNQKTDF